MIFNVPVKYRLSGLRKGNERAQTMDVWDICEIDIPVVDENDAVVVARSFGSKHFSLEAVVGDLEHSDTGGVAEYRKITNGPFVTPVFMDDDHPNYPATITNYGRLRRIDADRLAGMQDGELNPLFPTDEFNERARKRLADAGWDAHAMFERVHSSDRDTAFTKARDKAASLFIVGGVVHRTCEEPVIALVDAKTIIGGRTVDCTAAVAVERGTSFALRHRLFFLEDAAAARATLAKKNAKHDAADIADRVRFPEVDETAYNAETAERVGIWRLARSVLEATKAPDGARPSKVVVGAWYRLREALDVQDEPNAFAVLEDAVGRLSKFGWAEGSTKAKIDHLAYLLDGRSVDLAASISIDAITKKS